MHEAAAVVFASAVVVAGTVVAFTVVAGEVVGVVVGPIGGVPNLNPDCEYTTKAANANTAKSKITVFFFIVIN